MKKLLSILATVGLVATTGATVVACGPKEPTPAPIVIKSINDVKVEVWAGKTTNLEVQNLVLNALQEVNENVTQLDFTIKTLGSDDAVVLDDAVISVSALETSKLIEGNFNVKV